LKYEELAKINVNEHTEKKGDLTYLSWAWAVDQLLRRDESASWEYKWIDNKPYCQIADTLMVFCTVQAFGRFRTAQLPVMDYKNKAILNPDAMQVNTAMQRCLAKAIALHGIGLYIYAGEDLPEGNSAATAGPSKAITPVDGSLDALSKEDQEKAKQIANGIVDLWNEEKTFAAYELFYENNLDNEMKLGIWEVLKPFSKIRNGLKKMHNEQKAAA
jgi:hypothetical protein